MSTSTKPSEELYFRFLLNFMKRHSVKEVADFLRLKEVEFRKKMARYIAIYGLGSQRKK
jgi:hypothetical protein